MHLTSSRFFGGPERQMLGLAEALQPEAETVFASFSEGGLNKDFLAKVHEAGFVSCSLERDTPKLLAAKKEVAALIKQHDVNLLLCHGYKAVTVGWFAARKVGIPVIAVSRGWTAENWKIRIYERLDRFMLRKMERVVCVSHGQADRVKRAGVRPERIEVIHNAIDMNRFSAPDPACREKLVRRFPPSVRSHIRFLVGAAGRLSPEKGFDILVEAARTVIQHHPDVGFLLFGEGALRESLQSQIDQASLKDHFQLAGYTDELDQLMPCLDLFVQSSYTEGLPNVLLEATAAGTPIVATQVGGTPEVVQPGEACLLLEPGCSRQLADCIQQIKTKSDNETLPTITADQLQEKFSFSTQREAYLKMFRSMLGNGHNL
ncbi:MAG: glycosyltransferase [Mariniblastus sp.]|nr:glycosyltransferase [Mariniblastus sp.]